MPVQELADSKLVFERLDEQGKSVAKKKVTVNWGNRVDCIIVLKKSIHSAFDISNCRYKGFEITDLPVETDFQAAWLEDGSVIKFKTSSNEATLAAKRKAVEELPRPQKAPRSA